MAGVAKKLILSDQDEEQLTGLKYGNNKDMARRATAIHEAAQGTPHKVIAQNLSVSEKFVSKWTTRFRQYGMSGLEDLPSGGRKKALSDDEVIYLIQAAKSNSGKWTAESLQKEIKAEYRKEISLATIRRALEEIELVKHAENEWGTNYISEFHPSQTEIVGLYMNFQYQALVILTSAEGYEGQKKQSEESNLSTEYHGTQNLLVALIIAKDLGPKDPMVSDEGRGLVKFLDELLKHYHSGGLFIILNVTDEEMDSRVFQWLSKRADSLRLEYLETKSSETWYAMVELELRLHTRKVIEQGPFKTKEPIVKKTLDLINESNVDGKLFNWQKLLYNVI